MATKVAPEDFERELVIKYLRHAAKTWKDREPRSAIGAALEACARRISVKAHYDLHERNNG